MPDFSMDLAYKLGREISTFSGLPKSIDTTIVAQAINDSDGIVAKVGGYEDLSLIDKERFKSDINKAAEILFPKTFLNQDGASVLLRLWAGCLWAAKSIALETRDGVNTPDERMTQFENNILPRCQEDPVFQLGVMSAPKFKKLRNNPVSFEGIPENILTELHYE